MCVSERESLSTLLVEKAGKESRVETRASSGFPGEERPVSLVVLFSLVILITFFLPFSLALCFCASK